MTCCKVMKKSVVLAKMVTMVVRDDEQHSATFDRLVGIRWFKGCWIDLDEGYQWVKGGLQMPIGRYRKLCCCSRCTWCTGAMTAALATRDLLTGEVSRSRSCSSR